MTRHYHPAHRRQAIQWAQNLLRRDFYVLDTETTGLGPADEIVQIAIVDKGGALVMQQLIKPTVSMHPAAEAIHGISAEDLADAPSFKDIYIKLSTRLAGQALVAYNMEFDWRMLEQSARAYGLPPLRAGKRHCAMQQYARFNGKRRPNGRSYIWHKLTDAAKREGLPTAGAHTAAGDVRMTLALIQKMAGAD